MVKETMASLDNMLAMASALAAKHANDMSATELSQWRAASTEFESAIAKAKCDAEFVAQVAAVQTWDHGSESSECDAPTEGHEDSHHCLMNFVAQARKLSPQS